MTRARGLCYLVMMAIWLLSGSAAAFPHIVQPDDTLASLAERYYGRIQYERVLVVANRLDLSGGTPLVPGMQLEIPTVSYHVVHKGDSWASLAARFLGSTDRADVLALANGSNPWLIPEPGARILIPYNLAVLIEGDETVMSLAQKYLGDARKAWTLTHYNKLKHNRLQTGSVFLIPMQDLELTDAGRDAVRALAKSSCDDSAKLRRLQRNVAAEIPALVADIRGGRYVDAVARGNRFIASNVLTTSQKAVVYRQLLEAYVALDSQGAATAACSQWRKADPKARLDPAQMSPKTLQACLRAGP